MRPCNLCGAVVGNDRELCADCDTEVQEFPVEIRSEKLDLKSNTKPKSFRHYLPGFIEISVYVGTIASIPVLIISSLFISIPYAVLVSIVIGGSIGICFACLEISQTD